MERTKAVGLRPGEPIPDWVYQARTPEEAAALVKPMRIRELERQVFAPAPRTFEQVFRESYDVAKLGDVKTRIEGLDARIRDKRTRLLAEEAEIGENPWLTEASRVGRIKRLYDMAQKDIELLADERKLLTEQYREGVGRAEKIAERIDEEVDLIIKGAQKQAELILLKKKNLLDKVAKDLIEKEIIEKARESKSQKIIEIMRDYFSNEIS